MNKRFLYKNILLLLQCLVMCFLVISCTSSDDNTTTTFKIRTTKDSNNGSPFYVVVKSTDFQEFILDDYQKIANEHLLKAENPENLELTHLIPGYTKTIKVKTKNSKRAAIYFLFSHPGAEWKFMSNYDRDSKVKILIGQNEIKSTAVY